MLDATVFSLLILNLKKLVCPSNQAAVWSVKPDHDWGQSWISLSLDLFESQPWNDLILAFGCF